ncbi:CPBP family intramembrane metalloprotease, partial [Candidatus Bathyarchaeota archaeon]|nr:CPBP family intramembrane metalloprotease [Candidatus Bathyarchaeota archaeon]
PPMRYLFSGILILTAAATLIKVQGLRPHEVGLTLEKPLVQAVIPFTGIPLGIIEYQILKPPILASNLPINQWIALALAIIFSTGFVEELVFRGIIQNSAIQALGTKTGLLGASIIFAALHIGWYSIPDLVFVFSAGLFFGILVLKTRSILGVSLSHGIVNILLFMILPIQ